MELNAVLNDNLEIDYFESNEKSGAISKRITIETEDGYLDVKEVICNGSKIIYANEPELISAKTAEYEALQNSVESAAARGYVDSIVDPVDTRKYVAGAFEMLYSKRIDTVAKKHGTV